jgi:hypothetical protein
LNYVKYVLKLGCCWIMERHFLLLSIYML